MSIIKFIIAEESFIIRKGLVGIINSFRNTEIVKEVDNKNMLIKAVNKSKPDFLIVNLKMFEKPEKDIKNHFSECLKTKFIAFIESYGETKEFPYFEEKLNLYDSKTVIDKKISTLISGVTKEHIEISSYLTERERDVVKQVSLGKINKEIADSLSISIHTVISHRKNIVAKLGIKTVSGLTVYAILNKIISIDEGL